MDQGWPSIADQLVEAEGYVVDLTLADGTCRSGVVIGVSSTAVILDEWDTAAHRPAGSPVVIEFGEIVRVVVP